MNTIYEDSLLIILCLFVVIAKALHLCALLVGF